MEEGGAKSALLASFTLISSMLMEFARVHLSDYNDISAIRDFCRHS